MKYRITLNGKNYEVSVEQSEAKLLSVSDLPAPAVPAPAVPAAPVAAAPAAAAPAAAQGEQILAPMPGTILKVNVALGENVTAGQVLMILEAMKMENEIAAPCNGTVKQLPAKKGAAVNTDDLLAVI
ncbi:MAG: acetyl-CoA carboxylase biotin carboxyl carrier protein subunit [Oscillospiraceae bacterium]|jgi:biotin carboxyl carrier protein|nr:acetyl-CoA carboxylase biotin carboxyl carrier protein subunit [Oscillospiraceae bacterium]